MKRRLTLAAMAALLVYGMSASLLGTLLPDFARRFAWTDRQNGSAAFAQSLGLMAASLGAGPLIDTWGAKPGVLFGLALIALAQFALPSLNGFVPVAICLAVLGLGGGAVTTAVNALPSDSAAGGRASKLNLLNLFFGLGGFLTPMIGAWFFTGQTLRMCSWLAVAGVLTLALWLTASVPHLPPRDKSVEASRGLFLDPLLLLLALFLFLYVACEVGVWNWLARFLVAEGIPERTALRTLSFGFALGMLVGRAMVVRIVQTVPAITVTLASAVLMVITTSALLAAHDSTVAGIFAFCAGLAMAPVFPTTLGMVGDAFPGRSGAAVGFAVTAGWIGLAVSSQIIGAIAGSDPARLRTALLVLPLFSLAMIGVNVAVRGVMVRRDS